MTWMSFWIGGCVGAAIGWIIAVLLIERRSK